MIKIEQNLDALLNIPRNYRQTLIRIPAIATNAPAIWVVKGRPGISLIALQLT
jgi:hypothetical protein